MKKRCYNCKCLEEESPTQFYKRTKQDAKAKFFCRKCRKNSALTLKLSIKDSISSFKEVCKTEVKRLDEERKERNKKLAQTETAKKCRRRYEKTDKGKGAMSLAMYNYRLGLSKKKKRHQISDEERMAIGRFYRMCPVGFEVDHIIPLCQGGKHELENLQYLSIDQHRKKSAKERTKTAKVKVKEIYPFTPICEQVEDEKNGTRKRLKGSKFKSVRRLVEK